MCVMVVVIYVCVCAWSMVGFIAIAWDETSILVAVHFSMKKDLSVMWSGPSREVEQRRRESITFFVDWRLRDVGRVLPWR